jgi:hypothetical protein
MQRFGCLEAGPAYGRWTGSSVSFLRGACCTCAPSDGELGVCLSEDKDEEAGLPIYVYNIYCRKMMKNSVVIDYEGSIPFVSSFLEEFNKKRTVVSWNTHKKKLVRGTNYNVDRK